METKTTLNDAMARGYQRILEERGIIGFTETGPVFGESFIEKWETMRKNATGKAIRFHRYLNTPLEMGD